MTGDWWFEAGGRTGTKSRRPAQASELQNARSTDSAGTQRARPAVPMGTQKARGSEGGYPPRCFCACVDSAGDTAMLMQVLKRKEIGRQRRVPTRSGFPTQKSGHKRRAPPRCGAPMMSDECERRSMERKFTGGVAVWEPGIKPKKKGGYLRTRLGAESNRRRSLLRSTARPPASAPWT